MRCSLAVLLALAPGLSMAATYTVTRFDDPAPDGCLISDCSLREAAIAASALADPDTIVLAGGTYFVSRIDPTPSSDEAEFGAIMLDHGDISLIGTGSAGTRVKWVHPDASPSRVVVSARPRAGAGARTVNLQGLVISHGTQGCVSFESSPAARDQLQLTDVIIEQCSGYSALHMRESNLTMSDSQIRDNVLTITRGAGVSMSGSITVLTSNVQIVRNLSSYSGGGVSINGSPVSPQSYVTWVDDGRSVIANNEAVQDGGGIMIDGYASLHLATVSTAPIDQRMTIRDNIAGRNGGGVYASSIQTLAQQPLANNRFDRVRLAGNSASRGGGAYGRSQLQIVASEIAGNSAVLDGGGVYFETERTGRSLQQVSLRGNQAGGGGGAIASDCGNFDAVNASFDSNRAASGRGQAIETLGEAALTHVTVSGNSAHSSPGIRKGYHTLCASDKIRIANSLVTDNCSTVVSGGIVSSGGNQYGVKSPSCPAIQTDRRQTDDSVFGLRLGAYGGAFDVWGWGSPSFLATWPQRNFGLTANCSAIDIRGLPRGGRCDAGAFELQ